MSTPKKLPLGIQSFAKIIEGGHYYVDKTEFAWRLIDQGQYFFLSRPRRFGKSLFLDTLKEIFEGRRELFAGLAIDKLHDFSQTWPVLRLNFATAPHHSPQALADFIHLELAAHEQRFGLAALETRYGPARHLTTLIRTLAARNGQPVVVLVDEYDKPILDSLDQADTAKAMRGLLSELYNVLKAEDANLRFVFLTGVSKFAKAGLFSGLNHLRDITLERQFGAVCGYTAQELQTVFADRLADFDMADITRWYNGYRWLGDAVYNPWSLLSLLSTGQFRNYWFESGTPSFLVKLLQERKIFLPRLEHCQTHENLLSRFDIGDISTEALMFQTGYLTIRESVMRDGVEQITLAYPNHEVRNSLNSDWFRAFMERPPARESWLDHLVTNDWDAARLGMHAQLASLPHHWHTRTRLANHEGWYAGLVCSYLQGLGQDVRMEDATNLGRVDIALLLPGQTVLFELKVISGKGDGAALAQLLENRYADKYRARGVPIWLVGITFSAKARNLVDFRVAGADARQVVYAFPAPDPTQPNVGE